MSRDRRRLASAAIGLAAVASLWGGLILFRGAEGGHAWGWRLYGLALALAVAAAWPWPGRPSDQPPVSRREGALLALVVIAGGLFRAYRLGSAPYGIWFDEAQNGLEAMRILAEPDYRPVFIPGISQLPALVFYYFALFVRVLGANVLALRVGSTLVGLAAIVAVWALGRELFGRRVGLLAAALLALSRWHVSFSRFAVSNLAVTLFLPLAILLFVRALRRQSPRDAVLCGLALGLGLQSYYAMLAGPVVVAALFLLEWVRGDARGRAPAILFATVLAVTAFTYAPVLQYARTHPQEYGRRVSATTFVRADSPLGAVAQLAGPPPQRGEAWSALGANLKAHALMFHVRGDGNGRHNLPGAPMLDPVSGLLFALGLAWCLARPFETRRSALLLPFLAMTAAGVLSLTFEAPQAARTLGATPFVALMGAVPLSALARRLGGRPGLAAAAGVLAVAGAWAAVVFDRQLWDASAWESWSAAETRIGETVRAHGAGADVYVTETLAETPSTAFALGRPLRASLFERGRDLPLPDRGRAALLFFPGGEEETAARVRELYPGAEVAAFGAPRKEGGIAHPILWEARVPAQAIAATQGWTVAVERGGAEESSSAGSIASDWDWSQAAPPFTARVRGTLRVTEDALRTFVVEGAAGSLTIDGEEVLGGGARSGPLRLARGLHEVALTVPVTRRGLRTALRWTVDGVASPIPHERMFAPDLAAGGLLGAYHAGADLAGEPALVRVDPQVSFYFHLLPLPRPFSVRWSGSLYAPAAGRYGFGTAAIDSSSVAIDGQTVLTNEDPSRYVEKELDLEAGWHAIEVRYRATSGYSQVVLQWVPPGGPRERVPAAVLRPPGPRGGLLARDAPAPTRAKRIALETQAGPPPAATPSAGLPPLAPSASRDVPFGEGLRVAAGRDGRLYVLDPRAKRVFLLRGTSAPVALPDPAQPWVEPSDLAVAPDGAVHVLDASGFVAVYSAGLKPQRALDLRPLGVYNPRGLAVGADEVLLADTGLGRVLVLDREGRVRETVGRPGRAEGELVDPVDVARDGAGAVVVVDAGNGRIQRFARDGRAVSWPRAGERPGMTAERVDTDPAGAVWVGGGGAREVWRLAPGQAPERHALAETEPDGLAAGAGRVWLTFARPSRVVELRVP